MDIKRTETLFKSYFTTTKVVLENKGKEIIREVINKKSAVGGIVYNTLTNKFIFVKQWRPGCMSDILEVVAGTLDVPGEDPKECMIREIEEEIGYKVDKITLLREPFYVSPGWTNEQLTLFYCEVSEAINLGGGVEDEDITEIAINSYDSIWFEKNGKMKILAQFGIFIRIRILNIGGKNAHTHLKELSF